MHIALHIPKDDGSTYMVQKEIKDWRTDYTEVKELQHVRVA